MLDKLFNKLDPKSKVKKDTDEDTKVGVSSLRIVAKNTLVFKTVAKELKAINGAFGNYLKLNNIRPAVGEPVSATTKSLADSKEFKMAKVKVQVSRQGEKRQTFAVRIVDKILNILKIIFLGVIFSVTVITEKIVNMISSVVTKIYNAVTEGATDIINGVRDFFKNVDWSDLLTSCFKKYLNFISFGFIDEEQTGKIMGDAGSAYKSIVSGIGGFLKEVMEWIKPKLKSIGRFIGKDILGVDVDKVIEKRNEKKRLADEVKKLEEESANLDNVTKELVTKRDRLKLEKEKREKEQDEKRKVEAKEKEAKKPSVLERIFKQPPKEEKKEEVKPTPPPIEERGKPAVAAPVTPAPAPAAPPPPKAPAPAAPPPPKAPAPAPAPAAKPEPKVDVSKVPGSVPPIPADIKPEKEETSKGNLRTLTKQEKNVDISQFKPAFEERIIAMAAAFKQQTGKMLLITSGYRSNERQKELYDADLAKNNGKPSGKVAQPMPPLGKGTGSVHIKGLGIDIDSKEANNGLNVLAGPRDKPTGWLEKFGLIRNVKGEDWHVTIAGAPPTPDDAVVTTKSGATIDPATGQSKGEGLNVGKSSTEIAAEQRKQSKSNNPLYINATTTNNTVVEKNITTVQRATA